MKHLEEFRQAVRQPFDYARQLKKTTGKKIIGYVCSYTPEEIILAAGAHPMRLFGTKENIHLADSHLQSYCCSVVRGVLEEGLSGRVDFLDGMVFPHTCDSIQRLSDIWRMNIPFGFHLDVVLPVKLDTESARDYMLDVLRKFRTDLGLALGVDITDEALQTAINTMNAIRQSIRAIYELRSKHPRIMSGEDLYNLVRASMIMDRDHVKGLLSETVSELKAKANQEKTDTPVKRIILAGGICNHPDIYPMIEDTVGAIVWDDFCTGARYFTELIGEGTDPITRIAGRLLHRVVCPAKFVDLDGRAKHIIRLVQEQNAQAVIFLLLKFCDPHAFDYPYLRKSLDEAGIPVMLMEIDDPLPPEGQLKTRFEAFLEML
ncbi:MAG: (R)-phenyllactyl-CoA dehydratase beta subunit [Syntrophus sp. SKADARSKE-3]|nr:(R)-phenyllactyl-CoA dehydratase beta subunit [Syntrophus sp. SKADARSKE-3]